MEKSIRCFVIPILLIFCSIKPGKGDANPHESQWTQLACENNPVARHENAFVEVNDTFYLLGGRGIKVVNIFDPQTLKWTEGAKPPIEIHHFQAVTYNNLIYVIGAMTGRYPNEIPLSHILIYNPVMDEWIEGDLIPEERRRGSAGIVVVGNKAIVICGIVDGHNGGHVTWVDQYDIITGKWKQLEDAPNTRDHFAAVEKDGLIYCAGGRNTSAKTGQTFELTIPQTDVYDIAGNTWKTLPESGNIPTTRAGASTVVLGNEVVVIGGESGSQSMAHNEVEALDVRTGQWRTLNPLVTGRHGTQAILYRNAIYIVAGSGNRGGRPELDTIEKYGHSQK